MAHKPKKCGLEIHAQTLEEGEEANEKDRIRFLENIMKC